MNLFNVGFKYLVFVNMWEEKKIILEKCYCLDKFQFKMNFKMKEYDFQK